jgi:hypothetical protein
MKENKVIDQAAKKIGIKKKKKKGTGYFFWRESQKKWGVPFFFAKTFKKDCLLSLCGKSSLSPFLKK